MKNITPELLLEFAPENLFLAALFIILLYAFKSLTVFFPLMVISIAGGYIFPPAIALFVNSIGILVELSITYIMGRFSGNCLRNKLYERYPKVIELLKMVDIDSTFTFFFLRVISCLPGDIVGRHLGSRKVAFKKFIIGSYLGSLPSLVCATLLGNNINDPNSPMFWVSLSCTVCIAAISLVVYLFWQKCIANKQISEEVYNGK